VESVKLGMGGTGGIGQIGMGVGQLYRILLVQSQCQRKRKCMQFRTGGHTKAEVVVLVQEAHSK